MAAGAGQYRDDLPGYKVCQTHLSRLSDDGQMIVVTTGSLVRLHYGMGRQTSYKKIVRERENVCRKSITEPDVPCTLCPCPSLRLGYCHLLPVLARTIVVVKVPAPRCPKTTMTGATTETSVHPSHRRRDEAVMVVSTLSLSMPHTQLKATRQPVDW